MVFNKDLLYYGVLRYVNKLYISEEKFLCKMKNAGGFPAFKLFMSDYSGR